MAQRVPITIRLNSFEGPLDLLLYLIQSHELDVSKVSLTKITDQYLAYVKLMQELNFDAASEFLVMAATLLHWKSRALLPQEEKGNLAGEEAEGIQTPEDLIRQLLLHQRFLDAGEDLIQLPQLGRDVFTKINKKPPIERVWKEMNISGLALTYQDMLVRARKRTQVLRKETVSITDKIMEFADRLPLHKLTEIRTLLSFLPTRPEIVATFLASLELGRLKKMRLHQEGTYTEIFLELLESLKDFDLQLAVGFESIEARTAPTSVAAPSDILPETRTLDEPAVEPAFEPIGMTV